MKGTWHRIRRSAILFVVLAALITTTLAYSNRSGVKGFPGLLKGFSSANQIQSGVSDGQISPEGMQQIAALIAEKYTRTPAQQKMDSQLLQAVREFRGESMTA